MKRRLAAAALALVLFWQLAAPSSANAGEAPRPNLALTQSVVTAGGGAGAFSTATLFDVLTGAKRTPELVALTKKFGARDVRSFFVTFDFLLPDGLKRLTQGHPKLPAASPDPDDGPALASELYAAGGRGKQFDGDVMFDHLVSRPIRESVMNDAARKYGTPAIARYRGILAQLMNDLKAQYKL
jgi:hypothetical protein